MRVARRNLVLAGAAAGAVAAALLGQRALDVRPPLPRAPGLSILAVGDVGDPPGLLAILERQQAVGRALEHEDRRAPVDALVFLGDNFYEHGIARDDFVQRLRGNLVAPYCRFVELAGPRSDALRGACPAGDARPRPPLYAVLGNHDTQTAESRELQTGEIAQYVSNWRMPAAAAEVVELGSGVSLVLFDSNQLVGGGDPAPLRDALRAARGPWRIVAAHHPIGTSRDEHYGKARGVGAYGERVRQAIREADVEVHVMLAGHEHNLQLLRVDPPGPRLVVVSGAGARPKKVRSHSRARLFKYEGLGFARVDLVRDALGERLAVTLYGAPYWTSLLGAGPEVLARWSVVRGDGHLLREPIAVRSAGLL
jgi:hypothetical protein